MASVLIETQGWSVGQDLAADRLALAEALTVIACIYCESDQNYCDALADAIKIEAADDIGTVAAMAAFAEALLAAARDARSMLDALATEGRP